MNKLPRSFYTRPALTVARELLGKILVRKIGSVMLTGKIVEAEAYLGESDPASHAFRGKTERNSVMFRDGGYLYVYFTYGMHFCSNVVTGKEGIARAVLLRAVEPVEGIEAMKKNR
ncbi:MAG: DNA-3-methyladenine glycosylase, partial [Bacteroidota bacterium]|nr:DNA-3-methyladenine glycosylase [Bacteroidota bacterium]